jgi:hypothetical protein
VAELYSFDDPGQLCLGFVDVVLLGWTLRHLRLLS